VGLTVVPNDDGTLDITQGGTTVTYDEDDVERCGLPAGDKRFLRSMFRHAVPGPTACRLPDPPAS
jgi:hypothetical protein